MAARYTRVACPSCGASLDVSEREPGEAFACTYCGSTVRPAQADATGRTASPPQRAASRMKGVLVGAVAVFLLITGMVVFFLVQSSVPVTMESTSAIPSLPGNSLLSIPPPGERLLSGGVLPGVVIPGRGGAHELLVMTSEDRLYRLHRVDGTKRVVRWTSAPFDHWIDRRLLVTDEDNVYVPVESRLTAIALDDGRTRWETSLVAEVRPGCISCFIVVGSRIVALQKDGSLQGFDRRTGALAWSRRVEQVPRDLPHARHWVALRDNRAGTVEVIDAGTGGTVQQINVEGPGEYNTVQLRSGDRLLLRPDQERLYAFIGQRSLYVQAWDLKDGTLLSHRAVGEADLDVDARLVQDGDVLYFGDREGLHALDLEAGTLRTILAGSDHLLAPMDVVGDVLILFAAPTWDRHRWMLWGVNAQTGERRWQYAADAERLLRLEASGDWDVHLAANRLMVVQYLSGARDEVRYEVLDPRTGVSQLKKTVLNDAKTLTHVAWTDDTIWLHVFARIVALDARTGIIRYHVP